MSKVENVVFTADVVLTNGNRKDLETVCPGATRNARIGDTVKMKYTVNVAYVGKVYERLTAMTRLGADMSKARSTNALIKKVFKLMAG